MSNVPEPGQGVRAELIGDSTAIAAGVTAHGRAPVFELCRRLVGAGHDPDLRLEAYRGDVLALTIKSIGTAAKLTVDESHGCRFVRFRGNGCGNPDSASAIRSNAPALVRAPSEAAA
jgi:hypothetical protein